MDDRTTRWLKSEVAVMEAGECVVMTVGYASQLIRFLLRGWLIERARVLRLREQLHASREETMDAARTIATLIRERDEAREDLHDLRH